MRARNRRRTSGARGGWLGDRRQKRGVAPRTLRIMLFCMRSFSLDWLGLAGLTILSAACSHNGASPTRQAPHPLARFLSNSTRASSRTTQPDAGHRQRSRRGLRKLLSGVSDLRKRDRDLNRMTHLCGPPNSMKPVSSVFQGNQSQQDPIARFTFRGEMGRCYRIFSATDRGVT